MAGNTLCPQHRQSMLSRYFQLVITCDLFLRSKRSAAFFVLQFVHFILPRLSTLAPFQLPKLAAEHRKVKPFEVRLLSDLLRIPGPNFDSGVTCDFHHDFCCSTLQMTSADSLCFSVGKCFGNTALSELGGHLE